MNNIENLNLEDLKKLLKQVKKYKDLKKQLGRKGVALFNRNLNNKDLLIVEYFGEISVDNIFKYSQKIYKEIFQDDIKKSEINFIRNDDIKGGIKIYKNDFMVDLSFLKIEKQIR